MLFRYFLKRFFFLFVFTLAGLIPLFASCDVVVRLASMPFSFQILKLFWFMLPLVCLFAIPIASCFAVGITVGNLFSRNELLLFQFFPQSRRVLECSVFLFSIVLTILFTPLLFRWAPESYWRGKQLLIHAAQQQIENLPAQQFHQIASRGTIFFEDKKHDDLGNTRFIHVLLMVREKNDKQYLVTAKSGVLRDGVLTLFDGTIYNNSLKTHCVATCKSLDIAFEKIFFESAGSIKKPPKFMSLHELRNRFSHDKHAWKELHKRLVQLLWQFLLPILIFLGMMIFAKQKSNILLSVVLSGAFFLFSYISVNMAYFFLQQTWLSLSIFYGTPFVILLAFYLWYRRKWG